MFDHTRSLGNMEKRSKIIMLPYVILLVWLLLPISSVRGIDLAITSTTAIDAVNGLRQNQTILIGLRENKIWDR